MIPTIETICEDLKAGKITVQQAIGWLHQHAQGAANELRDAFAAAALPAAMSMAQSVVNISGADPWANAARIAYGHADAMLKAREQCGGDTSGQ